MIRSLSASSRQAWEFHEVRGELQDSEHRLRLLWNRLEEALAPLLHGSPQHRALRAFREHLLAHLAEESRLYGHGEADAIPSPPLHLDHAHNRLIEDLDALEIDIEGESAANLPAFHAFAQALHAHIHLESQNLFPRLRALVPKTPPLHPSMTPSLSPISIHAHEALAFIDVNAGKYDAQTLPDALRAAFGAEARFHACSAVDMTPEDLLAFLLRRDKIVLHAGGFHLNRANICTH